MPSETSTTGAGQPDRRTLANAIRALSMDAVQAANSGHPGMPMGMADIAEVLWNDYLKHNPGNPSWIDRDRFVLSNGHGSMLLYSLLHLAGYPLPIDEIRNFRQFGRHTAGHPERDLALGIETTTGPLGQGITNAVGMALAEKMLAARFNRDGFDVVDHRTWVFTGDGCLMEGISHEACSLAGTWKLGKLICLYDDNGISIDGETDAWFTDDTASRFEAYGWQVIDNVDGHDSAAVAAAIEVAMADTERPSLICCKTVIGWGSPNKQGTASTHGAPLGDEEIELVRKQIGWDHPPFEIPADVTDAWNQADKGAAAEAAWQETWDGYRAAHPELADELERRMRGDLPADWNEFAAAAIAAIDEGGADMATRKASLVALNAFAPALPELVGGSADLTGSNLTKHSGSGVVTGDDASGNYLYFGVREFGMAAICNGLGLHGGFMPYAGTFLVFSDYARNALRMAALMEVQNIFVFTHDSIGLGEDGPTHQPVEHTQSLRIVPNMRVWRPCDAVETAVAWRDAIERRDGPTSLVLTRQGLPHQARSEEQIAAIGSGGYVLRDADGEPDLILIATGSEVPLAVSAAEELTSEGVKVRVVSMPCTHVLFGQSAPAGELFRHYGFSHENVIKVAREVLAQD
jgi:transketolase